MVTYWLYNSPDASWTTLLANAVERMGGHTRLAETLREREHIRKKPLFFPPHFDSIFLHETNDIDMQHLMKPRSTSLSLDVCIPCSILFLGKMGHGKSTLGNRIFCRF